MFRPVLLFCSLFVFTEFVEAKTWYTYWQNAKRPLPKAYIPNPALEIPINPTAFKWKTISQSRGGRVPVYGASRFQGLSMIGTIGVGERVSIDSHRTTGGFNYFKMKKPRSFKFANQKLSKQEDEKSQSEEKLEYIWIPGMNIKGTPK